MHAPWQIEPKALGDYLEVLTKAVFQSGISWRVVEAKADGIRDAFFGFDPENVASLTAADVERLVQDSRVIRNRKKIEATIDNARTMLALDAEFGGFGRYLDSLGGFEATVADLKRRFRFIGDSGAYYFLYVIGRPVPQHEEWMAAHPAHTHHPR